MYYASTDHIRQPITIPPLRRSKLLFLVFFLLKPLTMATECDVNKSRRFDPGMSRRTRRSTSLIACYQDQHVPSLVQQLRQDDKLKTLFQCQGMELHPPYPYEDQELLILEEPLQSEGDEQETPNRYHEEQGEKLHHYQDEDPEKKVHHYLDEEPEKKAFQDQDRERKTPKQYLDEDQNTVQQCQVEEKVPNQHGDEENTPGQYQDEEQKTTKQCKEEEEEEKTSEKYQDEEHKSLKAQHQCQDTERKAPGQCKTAKTKLITPPCANDVPRFSLQDLIQEKQLLIGEAKATSKLGNGKKAIADHKLPPPPGANGTTLAMVIKRPDGGKKSMGVIRRCVQALNQMVKAKHGSKKNKPPF